MDLSDPLKPDVLSPIVTLVLPGTIAVGPYTLILAHYVPAVSRFWVQHSRAFAVVVGRREVVSQTSHPNTGGVRSRRSQRHQAPVTVSQSRHVDTSKLHRSRDESRITDSTKD